MNVQKMGTQLEELLGLKVPPVAVGFLDAPPPGMARVDEKAPSGCSFWKRAAEGRSFYTVASDHHGCPVGAHTHHAEMPAGVARELEGMVGTMVGLGYLKMEDVAALPRLERPLKIAAYAPLASATFSPDVVILRGNARHMMLVNEAAMAAGVAGDATVGRPTCAGLPGSMQLGRSLTNLGCVGNRVYTGLSDEELYVMVPARALEPIVAQLAAITRANRELEGFHRGRLTVVQ